MPTQDLKIALIPLEIAPFDTERNLELALKRIDRLDSDTSLCVLPEMFNSGFALNKEQMTSIAESSDDKVIETLKAKAIEKGIAICGSYAAIENEKIFNRGFIIDDRGEASFYNKRHLFSYGGENTVMAAGKEQSPILNFRSWNLKMAICYDIRFPVWSRTHANDYDVLIVPANWPHSRFFAWKHLLIARAIENQAYVLGCNCEGDNIYGRYQRGDSQALDFLGNDIANLQDDGTIYAMLSAERLNTGRQRFAPWRDADKFEIIVD